jgi:hypothetical protein
VKAIDYSSFSTGNAPVPVATFQKIRSLFAGNDMLLNIPGAWHGASGYSGARQSIVNGRQAGFTHAATYTAINSRHGRESVERAQSFIGNEWDNLAFIGIDVELPTNSDIVNDAIVAARAMGVEPFVYTAHWAWHQFMQNRKEFGNVPLWNAFYDNNPDFDFPNYPFGAWTLAGVAGEQYTNTTHVDGLGFDFNQFHDAAIVPPPPPPVPAPHPLTVLVESWKTDMADIAVNAASLIHTPLDTLRLALHSIYTAKRTSAWKAIIP